MKPEILNLCAPCAKSKPLKYEARRSFSSLIKQRVAPFLTKFKERQRCAAEIEAAIQKQRDETFLKFGHLMNRF